MTIEFIEEPMAVLPEYARVPIVFTIDRVFDVTNRDDGPGGFLLSERRLAVPYEKDYDAIAGEGPLQWARRYNLSNWALFTARGATRIVGGATVAFDTPGLTMSPYPSILTLARGLSDRLIPQANANLVASKWNVALVQTMGMKRYVTSGAIFENAGVMATLLRQRGCRSTARR